MKKASIKNSLKIHVLFGFVRYLVDFPIITQYYAFDADCASAKIILSYRVFAEESEKSL